MPGHSKCSTLKPRNEKQQFMFPLPIGFCSVFFNLQFPTSEQSPACTEEMKIWGWVCVHFFRGRAQSAAANGLHSQQQIKQTKEKASHGGTSSESQQTGGRSMILNSKPGRATKGETVKPETVLTISCYILIDLQDHLQQFYDSAKL